MKFTEQDLVDAVAELALMQFFPHESKAQLQNQLRRMVPHKEALDWLTATLTASVPKWPGFAEVRALLITRYDPANPMKLDDELWCSLPGHTAADGEARHLAGHEERKLLEVGQNGALAQILKPKEAQKALAAVSIERRKRQ